MLAYCLLALSLLYCIKTCIIRSCPEGWTESSKKGAVVRHSPAESAVARQQARPGYHPTFRKVPPSLKEVLLLPDKGLLWKNLSKNPPPRCEDDLLYSPPKIRAPSSGRSPYELHLQSTAQGHLKNGERHR